MDECKEIDRIWEVSDDPLLNFLAGVVFFGSQLFGLFLTALFVVAVLAGSCS
jgi:hypothetical protein